MVKELIQLLYYSIEILRQARITNPSPFDMPLDHSGSCWWIWPNTKCCFRKAYYDKPKPL